MEDTMRIRILTFSLLALAATATFASQQFEPQSSIDWPPKAVPKQATGKVPDFKAKNQICLDCHKEILTVKSARKNIPNLHQLHLASKKTAYEGKNRDCVTCHETVVPSETRARKKEGWFVKGDVYHPNVMLNPAGVWKKLVVRGGEGTQYVPVNAMRQADPHIFKPTLKNLVCVECHGPNSKIKTFYGAPLAAK
jgi:cytochrome c553